MIKIVQVIQKCMKYFFCKTMFIIYMFSIKVEDEKDNRDGADCDHDLEVQVTPDPGSRSECNDTR